VQRADGAEAVGDGPDFDQRRGHLRRLLNTTSSRLRTRMIETPKTSEPTALVFGLSPERSRPQI
jgi:hypothetical protein